MGALHPEAPAWTEQFVDLVCRIASYREAARMLPRQVDLLAHERIVWRRDIDSLLGNRVGLTDPQAGRLIRLVAAFLRSQSAYVEVVDRALTTEIKTADRAAELNMESGYPDVGEGATYSGVPARYRPPEFADSFKGNAAWRERF